MKAEYKDMTANHEDLRAKHEDVTRKYEDMTGKYEGMKTKYEDLAPRYAVVTARRDALEKELGRVDLDRADMRSRINTLEAKRDTLKFGKNKPEIQSRIKTLESNQVHFNSTVANLRKDRTNARTQARRAKLRIEKLEAQNKELTGKLKKAETGFDAIKGLQDVFKPKT
jgi:chromosome segregation ATPase